MNMRFGIAVGSVVFAALFFETKGPGDRSFFDAGDIVKESSYISSLHFTGLKIYRLKTAFLTIRSENPEGFFYRQRPIDGRYWNLSVPEKY